MLNWLSGAKREMTCRVCGSSDLLTEIVAAPHLTFPDKVATFTKCAACDSISYVDNILAFEHIQEGDTSVFLRQYVESTAGIWEMLWPVAILEGAAGDSFLDVGCGFGFTADAWRKVFNEEAFGCDPAAYAQVGRDLLGSHIFHALLDDVPELIDKKFDIVYSSEVIEHVPDPKAFVMLLASKITENGIIALTTPAADFIDETNDPGTNAAALAPGFHSFLFSRSALESLLVSLGFRYVIVERHGERLLAWASNAPIVKHDQTVAIEPYLRYLRQGAQTLAQHANHEQRALRSGFAYRLYKESLLRGIHENIAELRALALTDVQLSKTGEITEVNPDALRQALSTVAAGPAAFGEKFRFNLPQIALLAGMHAEAFERNISTARAWCEIAQLATEKLCEPSVVHGLEAAAFYWQADAKLMFYDLLARDTQAACARLARAIIALDTPFQPTGGSAPTPEHVISLIETLVGAVATNGTPEGLALLRSIFMAQAAKAAPSAATFGFVATYATARSTPPTAKIVISETLNELSRLTDLVVDRTGRMRGLAKGLVETFKQATRPASFAALSSSNVYTNPGASRRV
jgi:SAM-dependent methyltransferase